MESFINSPATPNVVPETIKIASYFIVNGATDGEGISPMKLQKLVYFAHGWHLAFVDKELISEPVEAWRYGPVIPSIYHSFKQYGNSKILDIESYAENIKFLDVALIKFLGLIWESYKSFSALELSELTHAKDSPWEQVVRNSGGIKSLPHHQTIPNEIIKEYFKQIYSENVREIS
jgi:uncharacterized phage-associated protein